MSGPREAANRRIELYAWYHGWVVLCHMLPADERAELEAWERVNNPELPSSAWPGFAKYDAILGPDPRS